MGRKRKRTVAKDDLEETEDLEVEIESLSKKKMKKEKHRKKKAKRDSFEKELAEVTPVKQPLTLKIRFGNEAVVTTAETAGSDIVSMIDEDSINAADISSNSIKSGSLLLKQNSEEWGGSDDVVSVGDEESFVTTIPDQNEEEAELEEVGVAEEELEEEVEGLEEEEEGLDNQDDEEEEEEVWLEALESGNVDERGYLPQKKDPTAMTARQRAIFKSEEVELLELPLMKKRTTLDDEETQEMLLKKTERNKKRRLQAIKRREKHKAETVQKLLQKQSRKKEDKKIEKSVVGPHLRYINSSSGITLSLTEGLEYPLQSSNTSATPLVPPPIISCSMCPLPKRYNDSVTRQPLCSLECYKKLKNSSTCTLQQQLCGVTLSSS